MFESVVRTVLNKFLGEYVSNLETNQLNVGIFSGNVVLHGLELKREALDKLNLPVAVHRGYLGKLELQIPWTNLKQQPVIVTISDLFILAGPRVSVEVDEEEEAEKAFLNKMERLETAELFALDAAMHGEAAGKVVEETQNESFTTQLVTKIVDNLQVTIKNIHFRYEDDISHPEKELFSFGFTLENLSAFSTNDIWEETFVADAVDKIHKMVNLEDLSLYWDSWSRQSLRGLEMDQFLASFLEIIQREEDRNHVLCPITGYAKMVINKRVVEGEPKIKVNLFFDQFALLFDDSQYFDLLNLLNFFVMSNRLEEYRDLRPSELAPLEHPIAWFQYAVKAKLQLVQEKNRRMSWSYIMERRKDRIAYQDLFFQHLQAPNNTPVEVGSALTELERKLSLKDLKIYRSVARKKFLKWQKANQDSQAANAGWFSWLMSPGAEVKPTSLADLIQEEDIKELYDTIEFDESEQKAAISASPLTQLFQINFDLAAVSINVGKADTSREHVTSVASLVFRMFSGSLTKRTSSIKFEVALQELLVLENLLTNSLFPEVIRSRTTKYELEYDDDVPFFRLVYDQLTDNPDAEACLHLTMQPLEIVVNHQAAFLFKDFLIGGRNKDLIDSLMGIAADQLGEFKVWTQSSIERVLDEHKGLDFFIDIEAPVLVVPEDCATPNAFAFVADLGHVKVRSRLVTSEQKKMITGSKEGEALSRVQLNSIKEYLYDYLLTSLSSLQILHFTSILDCQKMLKGRSKTGFEGDVMVVDKVNFDLQIGTCLLPPNSELPDIKIRGTIPMINVMFSDEKYKNFMKLLDIFLPPTDGKDEKLPGSLGSMLNASSTSFFSSSSPRLILPSTMTSINDSEGSRSEDEFQDAVENPEDLRIIDKHEYDQTSIDMVFIVEHVQGTVVQRIGTRRSIGRIEAETLKVYIENRPWDIVVKTYLKAFKVTDLLDNEVPRILADGHRGGPAGSAGEEGLLLVTVTLTNPIHPLYKTKYSSAGITVDVDFSSLHLTMDPTTIMQMVRYATDTFPKSDETNPKEAALLRKKSSFGRSLSKLSHSAGMIGKKNFTKEDEANEEDSKILVNIRVLELCLWLGPERSCIGNLNLRSAAIGVTYLGTGKIILQGKLASFDVIPKDLGIGIYTAFKGRHFATVEGSSVVDFTYETFPGEEAVKAGHDVALTLKSGSMHICYMPQFLRCLFELLTELRVATEILNKEPDVKIYSIDEEPDKVTSGSKFHYEIDVLSPVIEMASPLNPEERLAFYPGNLSVSNSFKVDKQSPHLFDTFIDVVLRSLHIDVWHHHTPQGVLQQSSLAEPLDIDVRVTQAFSPVERCYAQLEVEVSLGVARFSMGNTEYTLALKLVNWFLATYPTVMERINKFLAAGSPTVPADSSPIAMPGDEIVTMEVSILIDSIEAAIYNYKASHVSEVPAEAIPLSDLSFKDVSIDYVAKSSGSFWVEGRVHGIGFVDTRPDPARCFKNILSLGKGKSCPEAPMLLARYEKIVPDKQCITKATLDTPQLIFVLDHLFSLKRFFSDGLPSSELIHDPFSAGAPSNSPDNNTSSVDEWGSSMMICVARSVLYLLENPYNPASEAIELSLPEIFYTSNDGGRLATLTIDDIKMAFLNMDDKEATRLLFLDPFDVITTIESEPKDRFTRYTISLNPIVLRFAYQDIAVFQSLLRQFSRLSGPAEETPTEEAIDRAIQEMTNVTLGSPPSSPSLPDWKSIYRINAESFRAVFVDDFSKVNRPFVEWLGSNLGGEFTQSTQLPLTGQATFTMHLTSYNVTNSHWEPLVETLPLTLTLSPHMQDEELGDDNKASGSVSDSSERRTSFSPSAKNQHSKTYTQAVLSSNRGVEAILSHSFLVQLSEFSSRMATVKETALTADREVVLPYVFHNSTGVELHFWVSGTRRSTIVSKVTEETSEEHVPDTSMKLRPGEKKPWTFQDWRSLRSSTEALIPMITCSLVGTPFEPVRNVSIESTGIRSYALRPSAGSGQRLIVETRVKNGVKHVYLRPPFIFSNDGKFPAEFTLDSSSHYSLTIEPGKTGSFPITNYIGQTTLILMRPKGLGYDWCTVPFKVQKQLFQNGDSRKALVQTACNHLEDTQLHPPFYYSLYGQLEMGKAPEGVDDDDGDGGDACLDHIAGRIHLRAPLQFMNQLPYRVTYRIYDRTVGFDFGAALAPGASAQLHLVHAKHVIGLSLEIPDADLRSTEISLINDEEQAMIDGSIPMVDSDRVRVELKLAFALKKGGTRKVSLYAPYAIINLTGLPLAIINNTVVKSNQEVAGLSHANDQPVACPILYSYPESIALRDRVRISVAQAEYSSPISMESVGAGDSFDVHDTKTDSWYNLAMTVKMGPAKFEPCKIVRILPRFVLVNSTSDLFMVIGVEGSSSASAVQPGKQVPFHVAPDCKSSVHLSYQIGTETIRTAGIAVEELGKIYLKAPGSKTGLLRIDRILQEGATIFISVREESIWPWLLVNESSLELCYSQSKWQEQIEPTSHLLLPGETAVYSWEEPGANPKERRLVCEAGSKRIPIDIYDIGQLQPVMIKLPGGVKKSLAIDIVADGPVLQVFFRDFEASRSLFQYRRRSSSLTPVDDPTGSSNFEVKKVAVVISSKLCIQFPSIGVTLINRHLEEVLYCFAKDIEFRYSTSNLHYTYGLTVGWLQLDNQLFDDWDHPILLYPAVLSKRAQFKAGVNADGGDEMPPFLSLALIQSVDSAHGVTYYKYGGFLLQETVIDLGEHLMNKLVDFFHLSSSSEESPVISSLLAPEDTQLPDMIKLDTESSLLYFELLQLHPIKIDFSFSKLEGQIYDETDQSMASSSSSPLEALASVFTTVVGSVSNAPLRFNALILEHPIVRKNVLSTLIQQHYSQQAVSQVHRIIGSADFIGNPVGLFSTFGSGVSDFFYEPLLGLVSDRPGDIGIGLAKGSLALVRKTVVGLTDTFSKVTGSISKGATLLTFDPAFQQKRRLMHSRNRPKHALGGIVASAKHLFSGVSSGLTGIVEKPVEGAMESGIGGFFKGIGVGVVGAVVKPIVGVFDATTSLTEGIKNTAAAADGSEVTQIRLPRAIPYDGVIRSYSDHEARGQAILYGLHQRARQDSPHYTHPSQLGSREYYVAHIDVPADHAIALITTEAITLLEPSFRIIWRVPLGELTYARPHRDVVLLVVRQKGIRQRIVFLEDPRQQEWFCSQVEQALLIYNEHFHAEY